MKKIILVVVALFVFVACSGGSAEIDEYVHDEYVYDEYADGLVYENDVEEFFVSPYFLEYAADMFARLQAAWDEDNGEMWGVPLHTPVVFFCRETNAVAANRPDEEGQFERKYINGVAVYVGNRRMNLPQFSQERWDGHMGTFISYGYVHDWLAYGGGFGGFLDAPSTVFSNIDHYAMHILQPSLFGASGWELPRVVEDWQESIVHELHALFRVFETEGDEQRQAVHYALSIRAERREQSEPRLEEQFRGIAWHENLMKLVEGTAIYTELLLVMPREDAVKVLWNWFVVAVDVPELPSRYASFGWDSLALNYYGYIGGALYGLIMDEFGIEWRRGLSRDTDLGQLLADALGIEL